MVLNVVVVMELELEVVLMIVAVFVFLVVEVVAVEVGIFDVELKALFLLQQQNITMYMQTRNGYVTGNNQF